MENAKKVVSYYVLCNKLKDIVRTGWINWNVERTRVESVAEHIFSTQMLAIGMCFQYQYDIDIRNVLFMLAIHELEEIIIGNIPMSSKEHDIKEKEGHKAIKKILSSLLNSKEIEDLILEFDARETKEAIFAYHCDKLDCDLQAKLYDEENCVDLNHQENNDRYHSDNVQKLLQNGATTFTELWFPFDKKLYEDDFNFMEVFDYVRYHDIKEEDL